MFKVEDGSSSDTLSAHPPAHPFSSHPTLRKWCRSIHLAHTVLCTNTRAVIWDVNSFFSTNISPHRSGSATGKSGSEH